MLPHTPTYAPARPIRQEGGCLSAQVGLCKEQQDIGRIRGEMSAWRLVPVEGKGAPLRRNESREPRLLPPLSTLLLPPPPPTTTTGNWRGSNPTERGRGRCEATKRPLRRVVPLRRPPTGGPRIARKMALPVQGEHSSCYAVATRAIFGCPGWPTTLRKKLS